MKKYITKIKNFNSFYAFLGIVFIFLCWYIVSITLSNNSILPLPGAVIGEVWTFLKSFSTWKIIFVTLKDIIIIEAIAFFIALLLAIFSYLSTKIQAFFRPVVIICKVIPTIAIIILLIVLVGQKNAAFFIAIIVVFPILYEGILLGFKTINKEMLDDVKTISNFNLIILKDIYLKTTMPNIITSLLQSTSLGVKVYIMAQYLTSQNDTFGKEIYRYYNNYVTYEKLFAWLMILIAFVFLLEAIILFIKKKVEFLK